MGFEEEWHPPSSVRPVSCFPVPPHCGRTYDEFALAFNRVHAASNAWTRRSDPNPGIVNAERAVKAIQGKLDRLDEVFLFDRSIDIETYDRHAEKLREELTLVRIDRH